MKLLLIWLATLAVGLLVAGSGARAGYNDGLAAMERGDYASALQEFEALASSGHREAQFTLAFLYDFGQGTDPNPKQALKWYGAAAEQGLEEAQLALALMYADGRGVAQDHGEAAIWYRRAARQGNALAQNDLADFYRQGKGVPKDLVEAFAWYDAAAQDLPSGEVRDAVIESRDAVAALLSDEQLAEAIERAEAFRSETEIPPARRTETAEAPDPAEPATPEQAAAGTVQPSEPAEAPPIEQDVPGPDAAPNPGDSATAAEAGTQAPAEAAPDAPPPAEVVDQPLAQLAEAAAEPVTGIPQAERADPPDPGPSADQVSALPEAEAAAPEVAQEPPAAPAWPRLSDQETGQVIRVQSLLGELGYDPGPADGKPGGRTRAAVRAFEADHSWPLTGEITDRLEQTLVRVREGRKLVRFGQAPAGAPAAQPSGQRSAQGVAPPPVNPGFSQMMKNLLGEDSSPGRPARSEQSEVAALPGPATAPAAASPNAAPTGVTKVIDERVASLNSIVGQVGTVSAAGLGWNLLREWEQASSERFRQALSNQVANELQAGLESRRQSQIVLGDPYGNFLRVTDSYRLYLETLKERFQ